VLHFLPRRPDRRFISSWRLIFFRIFFPTRSSTVVTSARLPIATHLWTACCDFRNDPGSTHAGSRLRSSSLRLFLHFELRTPMVFYSTVRPARMLAGHPAFSHLWSSTIWSIRPSTRCSFRWQVVCSSSLLRYEKLTPSVFAGTSDRFRRACRYVDATLSRQDLLRKSRPVGSQFSAFSRHFHLW